MSHDSSAEFSIPILSRLHPSLFNIHHHHHQSIHESPIHLAQLLHQRELDQTVGTSGVSSFPPVTVPSTATSSTGTTNRHILRPKPLKAIDYTHANISYIFSSHLSHFNDASRLCFDREEYHHMKPRSILSSEDPTTSSLSESPSSSCRPQFSIYQSPSGPLAAPIFAAQSRESLRYVSSIVSLPTTQHSSVLAIGGHQSLCVLPYHSNVLQKITSPSDQPSSLSSSSSAAAPMFTFTASNLHPSIPPGLSLLSHRQNSNNKNNNNNNNTSTTTRPTNSNNTARGNPPHGLPQDCLPHYFTCPSHVTSMFLPPPSSSSSSSSPSSSSSSSSSLLPDGFYSTHTSGHVLFHDHIQGQSRPVVQLTVPVLAGVAAPIQSSLQSCIALASRGVIVIDSRCASSSTSSSDGVLSIGSMNSDLSSLTTTATSSSSLLTTDSTIPTASTAAAASALTMSVFPLDPLFQRSRLGLHYNHLAIPRGSDAISAQTSNLHDASASAAAAAITVNDHATSHISILDHTTGTWVGQRTASQRDIIRARQIQTNSNWKRHFSKSQYHSSIVPLGTVGTAAFRSDSTTRIQSHYDEDRDDDDDIAHITKRFASNSHHNNHKHNHNNTSNTTNSTLITKPQSEFQPDFSTSQNISQRIQLGQVATTMRQHDMIWCIDWNPQREFELCAGGPCGISILDIRSPNAELARFRPVEDLELSRLVRFEYNDHYIHKTTPPTPSRREGRASSGSTNNQEGCRNTLKHDPCAWYEPSTSSPHYQTRGVTNVFYLDSAMNAFVATTTSGECCLYSTLSRQQELLARHAKDHRFDILSITDPCCTINQQHEHAAGATSSRQTPREETQNSGGGIRVDVDSYGNTSSSSSYTHNIAETVLPMQLVLGGGNFSTITPCVYPYIHACLSPDRRFLLSPYLNTVNVIDLYNIQESAIMLGSEGGHNRRQLQGWYCDDDDDNDIDSQSRLDSTMEQQCSSSPSSSSSTISLLHNRNVIGSVLLSGATNPILSVSATHALSYDQYIEALYAQLDDDCNFSSSDIERHIAIQTSLCQQRYGTSVHDTWSSLAIAAGCLDGSLLFW